MPSAKPPAPMEALLAAELPAGDGWQYEPKWDGFRCLARRERGEVELISKSGKPLGHYFPEVVELLAALGGQDFLLDGELIISVGDVLAFDALQLRLHPAESRIRKLANETPAELILFDLLSLGDTDLSGEPLSKRRQALEAFHKATDAPQLKLSPVTTDRDTALGWLKRSGGALDGVIAKRLDQPYKAGERAIVKVKPERTADCVVGGFRYAEKKDVVGSLLLGLYDDEGLLHHVGFTSGISAKERDALTETLEKLVEPPGFTGSAPGRPSRWRTARSAEWQPLKPELVVEVKYDQVTAGRFRHGTALLRWRPDKDPKQCTFDQLKPRASPVGATRDFRDMTADLFGEPPIAGLDYRPGFISADEERTLVEHLSREELAPFRFQGWTGKRLTRTFGWRYDFDDSSFAPAEPIPTWLEPLRSKAAALAGVEPEVFVHALLVRYDPGAGIGWHRDRPVFERVVGVSLGSPAVLRFRRRRTGGFDRQKFEVEPRSAYLLSGPARHEWEHSIAPGESLRFSITFRTLSELGRRKAAASA